MEESLTGIANGTDVPSLMSDEALALLADAQADATTTIALVEALKARLDAIALLAWQALHDTYLAAVDHARPSDRADLARSGTVAEVMAATGLGEGDCWRRLHLAVASPERTATMLAVLTRGEATLSRVLKVHDRTRHLEPDQASHIAARTLAPARDGSPAAQTLVDRRLARLVAAASTPEQARDEREHAIARRGVHTSVLPDGSAELLVTGDAARVVAATTRIDRLARRARASGEHPGRTLAQLRSDITLDLLLHGRPGADPTRRCAPAAPGSHAGPAPGTEDSAPAEAFAIHWPQLGEPPPAHVQVIVPLSTLLGLDETPGELPGHGPLTADHTRDLAHTLGSVWQRLVVDPASGELLELSSTRYAAPPRLRAHVTVRDHSCRAPGCIHAADGGDLDHAIPWPLGSTTSVNLTSLHRGHHNLKTARLWRNEIDPDTGALRWRTLSGRCYTTYPHDHLETHRHLLEQQRPGSASGVRLGGPTEETDDGTPPIEHRPANPRRRPSGADTPATRANALTDTVTDTPSSDTTLTDTTGTDTPSTDGTTVHTAAPPLPLPPHDDPAIKPPF